MKLLSINADAKTSKGLKHGYLTAIMYMAPHTLGGFNVCQHSTDGCRKACLYHAGRGAFTATQTARIARAKLFFADRQAFMTMACREITALERKAKRENLTPVVRLNGTSDIPWERVKSLGMPNIMAWFPHLQFYDYTKDPRRHGVPENYHLTFSLAEDNDAKAREALACHMNVAVVFRTPNFPAKFWGYPVIDGDANDLRFLDIGNSVVGLKAKGPAKRDTSGFVRECN